jgi:hypothetical protein
MIVDSLINVFYFIDICINFRTTFISTSNGKEIKNPKLIANKYLYGRFPIDLLSSIPFSMLSGFKSDYLLMCEMFKFLRVLRIMSLIQSLNIKKTSKALLKVIWLFCFLILYLHIVGCFWYYVVKDNERWVCNYDFFLGGTYYIYEVYTGTIFRR